MLGGFAGPIEGRGVVDRLASAAAGLQQIEERNAGGGSHRQLGALKSECGRCGLDPVGLVGFGIVIDTL